MNEVYNETFWATMRRCRSAYRRLGDCIDAVIPPKTRVVDFGCGLGFVIERLQELGHPVTGYDAWGHAHHAGIVRIIDADLTHTIKVSPLADVAICTETGEHLPEGSSQCLVSTVSGAAQSQIIWSAAPPGQDEDDQGHINLQPREFWLSKFAELGWAVDRGASVDLRASMGSRHAQHEHCRNNFFVLVRQ